MAAAVPPVHKAGLRGGGHLIQQGAHGLPGGIGGILVIPRLGQDRRGLCLQLCHRVDPAAAAYLGRPTADEALPPRQMQFFPVHLAAVRAENIHIEQPPQRGGVLDIRGELLDEQRVGIQHIERLAASGFPADIPVQRGQFCPEKLLLQQLSAPLESPPDEGRILDRAADIHGKADQRLVILLQKHLLVLYPALPGVQHLHQGNLCRHDKLSFQRFFFNAFMNSCTCGSSAASLWQKM